MMFFERISCHVSLIFCVKQKVIYKNSPLKIYFLNDVLIFEKTILFTLPYCIYYVSYIYNDSDPDPCVIRIRGDPDPYVCNPHPYS